MELNPKELKASDISAINSMSPAELKEAHSKFPSNKPYLVISYGKSESKNYGTYGSVAALREMKHKVEIVGLANEEITLSAPKKSEPAVKEVKAKIVTAAPVEVEATETTETIEVVEETAPVEETAENAELLELQAAYFEKFGKNVGARFKNDISWIKNKLENE